MFANVWVLYKNPKLLQNWNSIGTYVFTVLLLIVRAVVLIFIFVDGELGGGIYKTFAAAECATFLMTCVCFSLLIQWYEVYHLLREAAGLEKEKDA